MPNHRNGSRSLKSKPPVGRVPDNSSNQTKKKGASFHKKPTIPKQLRKLKKVQANRVLTYVLDTNVLMTDWGSMFKFDEHEVCIVSQVWKELDKHKKGNLEKSWNARRAIKAIDNLVAGKTADELRADVTLVPPEELLNGKVHTGKLIPSIPRSLLRGIDGIK